MVEYEIIEKDDTRDWILMLHGIGGSASIWYKQINALSQKYNLILPDLYGHGKTREVLPAYTFEGLADEMARLLDHLGLEQVHVMGISLGSVIACFMGVYHPSRIRCLVLGGAALGMDFRTRSMLYSGHLLKQFVPYMWLYQFFAWIIMPRPSQAMSRKIFAREARSLGGREFKKWYRLMRQFPLKVHEFENSGFLDLPKLFISGRQDHLLIDQVLSWARRDPAAATHIIENCGHVCNIQAAEEFNRVALDYLKDSRPA